MAKIYEPRLTAPDINSKYYISYKNGGYNTAIVINQSTGSVLPNCVGYAQGRWLELFGATAVNWKLMAGDPQGWCDVAKKVGFTVGNKPKLGAVACWKVDNSGHVAIVEEIDSDGSYIISESGYNSYLFKTEKIGPDNKRYGQFLGFIYCGIDYIAPVKKDDMIYRVQVESDRYEIYAQATAHKIIDTGKYNAIIKYYNGYFRVQCGAFTVRENAEKLRKQLVADGYPNAYITTEGGTDVPL